VAETPSDVRIRAYNVGFGDCFLVTFNYKRGRARHALIDFGSTKMAVKGAPKSMVAVANQIATDCGGKLDMLVATHRHTDHISGFAGPSGKVIEGLTPTLVVQPWTERPDLAPDATGPAPQGRTHAGAKGLVARLDDMHAVAAYLAKQSSAIGASRGVPVRLAAQLQFLGETNIKNKDAVETLARIGSQHAYVNFGSKLATARILPGVKIDVLGPPSVDQSKDVTHQTARDANEFWQLAAATVTTGRARADGLLFPDARKARQRSQEARWVIPQIDRMDADEQLAIVRILDDAMNNTSVILLFDVGGTLLLFPGDAQIENWSYALEGAPNAAAIRKRLAGTRVYKVGHHGSLNATPKALLWGNFANRGGAKTPDRLITVVSTLAGKHGDRARNTEVPRRTLVAALEKDSDFHTTETGIKRGEFWQDVSLTF
jgi:hypothetical protein